jgi:protein MpaA
MEYINLEETKTKLGKSIRLIGTSSNEGQSLVIGVVHGDEPQGEDIINRYISEVVKPNVLFIPALNPDGKSRNTRVNSNGVDINRNFPTKNWELTEKDNYFGGNEPCSEIETKFLVQIIEKYKPKSIITLHTPYKIVNYDGESRELAQKISEIIGYPVEPSIGYPTPGSFGTYAGVERNIPTITLELDENETIENLYLPIKNIIDNIL